MRIRRVEDVKPDKSADQCAMRAYAERSIEGLARAAAEGYDVAGAVLDHLARQVSLAHPGDPVPPLVFRMGEQAFADAELEERKAPSQAAFVLRDHVVAHCAQIEMPSPVKFEMERISRFRPSRTAQWSTAVVVILRPRYWDARVIVFRVPGER